MSPSLNSKVLAFSTLITASTCHVQHKSVEYVGRSTVCDLLGLLGLFRSKEQ